MQSAMGTRTVKKAVECYCASDILSSNQGAQFTSNEYIELVKNFITIRISMVGKGRATDNVAIERFFQSYKWGRLYLMCPKTIREVKKITNEYMKMYNSERGH